MKKIFCALVGAFIALSLVACGNGKTPDDFVVFNMQLGGMNDQELKEALTDAVDNYVIKATLNDDTFPVTGEVIGMKINESFDLDTAASKVSSGDLTAEDIEKNLFTLGDDATMRRGIIDSYRAYLESLLFESDAIKAAIENGEEIKVEEIKTDNSTGAKVIAPEGGTDSKQDVKIEPLTEEEIAAINAKLEGLKETCYAHIEYSESENRFVGVDGQPGEAKDYSKAVESLRTDASKMSEKTDLVVTVGHSEGEKFEDSETAKAALEKANKYFNIEIAYSFSVPGGKSGTEKIDASNIKQFIFVASDGLSIEIDKEALALYASNLSKTYSNIDEKSEESGAHQTTVTRKGWETDSTVMYDNYLGCLEEVKSGSFTADYKEVNEKRTTDTGSTYVYVDLSSQTITLYVNDEVVASSPCVSGCVAAGHATPNGTYHIYYKQKNTYLVGADYRCFVNFWMPFNGGIGLHDASWKSTFGGTEYFYAGSHGCINLPYSMAKTIYDHVSAGTTVIVRGGVTHLELRSQSFSGTTSYTLDVGDTRTLNISADGGDPDLSYSSSDESVVTVDSYGNIKAVGPGSASIKVSAARTSDGAYNEGFCYVGITVNEPVPETTQAKPTETESTTEESTEGKKEPQEEQQQGQQLPT